MTYFSRLEESSSSSWVWTHPDSVEGTGCWISDCLETCYRLFNWSQVYRIFIFQFIWGGDDNFIILILGESLNIERGCGTILLIQQYFILRLKVLLKVCIYNLFYSLILINPNLLKPPGRISREISIFLLVILLLVGIEYLSVYVFRWWLVLVIDY